MRLVLDSNILIAALVKDSLTREIILMPGFEFLLPEFAFEEIARHRTRIARLARLTPEDVDLLLSLLMESVTVIPMNRILPHWTEAVAMIGARDPDDVPFVALALAEPNDGIWSNDRDYESLSGIKIWTTAKIKAQLRLG